MDKSAEDDPIKGGNRAPAEDTSSEDDASPANGDPVTVDKQISRRTWISFSVFFAAGAAFTGFWKWLRNHAAEPAGVTKGLSKPVRDVLNANEQMSRKIFSNHHLVKTYPRSMAAKAVRVNGRIGIKEEIDESLWQLQVEKKTGDVLSIGLDDLKKLPKTEIVFDFKCIEGWDQISYWGGVRFSDFIRHFGLQEQADMEYVGLVTPAKDYYVGIDMPSAMHPQTLLCYEVNGMPLNKDHGAPLRLIIPVKYGIKNLKRIGTVSFSNERPPDYWAERGYDYYSGL